MVQAHCSSMLERAGSFSQAPRLRLQPARVAEVRAVNEPQPSSYTAQRVRALEQQLHSVHSVVNAGEAAPAASHSAAHKQQRSHHHPKQQQLSGHSSSQLTKAQQARRLTAQISAAADVSELLLTLGQHMQQLDHIHISAAVKHGCRVLGLVLQLPAAHEPSQLQQQHSQQQEQLQSSELLWLQQLKLEDVQLRVQQLQQQQQLDRQQEQLQQHHEQDQQHASDNQQQQQHMQWLIDQQLAPQAMVQQQLNTAQQAQNLKQQQQLDPPPPSDSWLLLLLLSHLVIQHSSSMASQQLCTCLNGLSHLLLANPSLPLLALPLYRTALQQLMQASHQHMRSFDPRGLSVTLHAAAAIARSPWGCGPSQGFMKQWYSCSRAKLGVGLFRPLDLAMSAWALGRLQQYPPSQWMAAFWSKSKAAIPELPPHELLLLLVGVAYTEPTPRLSATAAAARTGWTPAVAQQLQPHLTSLTPQQLSITLLAFAKLNYQPSPEWLATFTAAWEGQQGQFSAKGHSMVLWGVGSMPHAQGQQEARLVWAKKLQAALQLAVSRAATAVAAVAVLRLRQAAQQQPQQQQQQQQVGLQQKQDQQVHQPAQREQQEQPQVPGLSQQQQQQPQAISHQQEQPALLSSASLLHPTDCAMAMYALARLGPSALDPEFTGFWLRQSKSQLGNMNSQELSSCLWALGKLGLQPPEEWLQQHLACSAALASCMSHKQLAMVLWGCARLQYLPHVLVTAELLMSAAEQLPSFTPHSLCLMVWALGSLRMKPNQEWMKLVLEQARYRFRRFDGQDYGGLLLGVYRMRYNPGSRWLDEYVKSLAAKVHMLSPKQHALIVAVLRAMGYSAEGKFFAWVMDEAAVAAMCNRDGVGSSSSRSNSSSSSSSGGAGSSQQQQ